MRLRDVAAATDMTQRGAWRVVTDLVNGGYVVKERDGRRNRYRLQARQRVHDDAIRDQPLGELLDVLVGPNHPSG